MIELNNNNIVLLIRYGRTVIIKNTVGHYSLTTRANFTVLHIDFYCHNFFAFYHQLFQF